jgi:hypothetical protein
MTTPFSGSAFPISRERLPDLVEIHYRVRCPDGRLGPLLLTRGMRIRSPAHGGPQKN